MALVVRLTPDDGYAWQNLGFFRRESGAHEDARAAYARAYQLLPEDPQVMNDYAVIHHYYLKDEDALVKDLYREAIRRAQAMLDAGGLTEADADRIRTALRDATNNLRKIEAGSRENG
jgi:cytochrome c-type biogenesis protein CcmH/NrfG